MINYFYLLKKTIFTALSFEQSIVVKSTVVTFLSFMFSNHPHQANIYFIMDEYVFFCKDFCRLD